MIRKVSVVTAYLLSLLVLFALPASAELRHIWAVDDGEKIFQDDLANPLQSSPANTVWDGTKVRLFGARNEIVAFQLILEAGDAGATNVDVHISDLVNGATHIRGSHPLPAPNDYLGVGVELFTEHYFNITAPSWDSPCGGFGWSGEAKPGITGRIPDALAPFAAKVGLGGAPFAIQANYNQGVWVDIYVPRDAPTGLYSATITVTEDGAAPVIVPLELEVFGITLSDENHYKSMVFYDRDVIGTRHSTGCCTQAMWDMVLEYNRMAHRHRIELIGSGDMTEAEALKGTLTGEAFTAAHNYQGPGEGVGNSLFSIDTYGVRFQPETEAGYQAESDTWVNWFTANAPDVEYFLYLCDEPGSDMYPWIIERASWIHNNPGPGHELPVYMTRWPIDSLIGSIDIWCCPPDYYNPADAAAAQARGEREWLYASYRPNTPADATDEYGIAWRLKPWIAHYRHIPRWFTWDSTHYYNNRNEVDPGGVKNPWVNPLGFEEAQGDGVTPCPGGTGNGDGILFYPGQDAIFPDQDRNFPGPCSSIRMKMYRRGVQDVEYMWLAEQAGHAVETEEMLGRLLPNTMWEAEAVPTWSNANVTYEGGGRWKLSNVLFPHRPFIDIPWDQWAKAEVEACVAAGIVGGYEDGTYRPLETVTREQMAAFVARGLAGGDGSVPAGPPTATFQDVATDAWAYKYVEYAVAQKIVHGYPDGSYGPAVPVDRGQMAAFMARAMVPIGERPDLTGYLPPIVPTFPDVGRTFWAYKDVEYIAQAGVAAGYPDGAYHPEYLCSRDQMAAFVTRAFGL